VGIDVVVVVAMIDAVGMGVAIKLTPDLAFPPPGLEYCDGRCVLCVDPDDKLPPEVVVRLTDDVSKIKEKVDPLRKKVAELMEEKGVLECLAVQLAKAKEEKQLCNEMFLRAQVLVKLLLPFRQALTEGEALPDVARQLLADHADLLADIRAFLSDKKADIDRFRPASRPQPSQTPLFLISPRGVLLTTPTSHANTPLPTDSISPRTTGGSHAFFGKTINSPAKMAGTPLTGFKGAISSSSTSTPSNNYPTTSSSSSFPFVAFTPYNTMTSTSGNATLTSLPGSPSLQPSGGWAKKTAWSNNTNRG